MATCKDCVHVEVCCSYLSTAYNKCKLAAPDFKLLKNIECDECQYFKDHSRFVELPDYKYTAEERFRGAVQELMDNGMIMFLKPTEEERVILRNAYDYFQQRIRGHSEYYKDGMIYKSEEMFGCIVELTRITFGVPHLIKLNKDDKQRADSFARAFVARYLNLVEDCIANKEVPILCISGEAVRKKE